MYWAISKLKFLKGIRSRLTLVYSILYGIFISIFVYLITSDSIHQLEEDFDKSLINYALDISNNITIDESSLKPTVILTKSDLAKKLPFSASDSTFSVRTLQGLIVYNSSNMNIDLPYYPELGSKPEYTHKIRNLEFNGQPYRAINVKIFTKNGTPYIIQLATPSNLLIEQTQRMVSYRYLVIPIQIIVGAFISYFIAGLALRPVRQLTYVANNIAAKNLSERVPEMDTGDEIEELSRTLNNLLNRLEVSFKAQEHFVANASHQLNTPLSIIKGELHLLTSRDRTQKEILEFHSSMKDEIDRLIGLVKNMLLISRVEAGIEKFNIKPVRIDEILLNTTSRLDPKAKDKKLTIRFDIEDHGDQDFLVLGDRQLLDSLFENLLDNAIKYSFESSTVKIILKKTDESVLVTIQDFGPGIPEELVGQVFTTRFSRGNSTAIPGNGIGLSIAQQIAQLHNAKITHTPGVPNGSIFEVYFPGTALNS